MRKTTLPVLCLVMVAVACDRTSTASARPSPLTPYQALPASAGPHGSAAVAQVACGATIVESVKLDDDLACTGDGLVAGADGITIDLNGHTIVGSGAGAGIRVTGRSNVRITGGTIRNFRIGVNIGSSANVVVDHNQVVGNPEGIVLTSGSTGNTVKDNIIQESATRGMALRDDTSANEIKANTFAGNRVGILVFESDFNTLKDNNVSGSILAGIRLNVLATGNVLKDNTVTSNPAGIEFLITPTGSATGNELKGNRIETNSCGLKGPTAGNSLKENSFQGNVTDTCS